MRQIAVLRQASYGRFRNDAAGRPLVEAGPRICGSGQTVIQSMSAM
ncbi:MAG TPA: hypothetical protein VFG33_28000 [Kribbella sp.]|nr:hypothetical protein [Kribbella sp.]HET6297261.1 hypothetical protein [Kribbella sp.]